MGRVKMKEKVWMLENIPKKKCRYCHSKENLTYDHKIPMIKGGKTEKSNIQVLCRDCNQMKSKMTHGEVKNLIKWVLKITYEKRTKDRTILPNDGEKQA